MNPAILFSAAPALSRIPLGGTTFGRQIDEERAFAPKDHSRERQAALFETAATYSAGAAFNEPALFAELEADSAPRS